MTRKGRDYRLGERSEYSPTHVSGERPVLPSFPVRLAQVHERRGERVVGKECGTEAHDGEQTHIVERAHGAEDEHEEHCAKDEAVQYSIDKRDGIGIGLTFFTLTNLNRLN